ncbi:hypothetical protein ACC724_38685, partial [Rhizobium ruizarguesonis]
WANFAGAQLASRRQERFEFRKRIGLVSLPDSSFQVTVGSLARSEILPLFDPKSWSDWFEILEKCIACLAENLASKIYAATVQI